MSAITGIMNFNREPVKPEDGVRLMHGLSQFPSDDIRVWQKDHVFLGCHAQWITPESVGEQLPFYHPEKRLAITADAIIDNRDELFDKLPVNKIHREGMPDSQLILLAYEKWGEDCPKHLVGDFAFFIWDERKQKIFGARDFSGSRTLYYFNDQKRFAFCTVINPLFELDFIKKGLDEQWLAEYLAISGVIDTADSSITPYLGIKQVPPSHSLSIMKGEINLVRYCHVYPDKKLKLKSDEEYVEAFQDVFQKSVKSRLRTFRKVGSHLSGGLDSGSVVSFAVKDLRGANKKLHTYSYIPPKDFVDYTPKNLIPDERPFITSTVQHIGKGIKDHYLDFENTDSYSEIDDFLEVMEMPYKFFENSFWLNGIFRKAHEDGIGILLNGARGNFSISWGPALDYYALLLKKFRLFNLYYELNQFSKNVRGARLRRIPVLAKLAFPFIERFSSSNDTYKFPTLINPDFSSRTGVYKKIEKFGIDQDGWFATSNVYDQRRRHFEDVFHWNASNTAATKLSLRYSLWERDPTNDLNVIQFCLSLPEGQFVKNGLDRSLIRRATKNHLPDKVRLNQRVRGVQGADWVHRMMPHWQTFINELSRLVSDKRVKEYLNTSVLETALAKAKKGPKPEQATDPEYRILMRSLIVYRFINHFN